MVGEESQFSDGDESKRVEGDCGVGDRLKSVDGADVRNLLIIDTFR